MLLLLSCNATMVASNEGDSDVPDAMYGKALNSYLLARCGDAEAQYQLASCYHSGYGVEENDSLAFVWAKKSAEQDYPAGLYFLAYCYETGKAARPTWEMPITSIKKLARKLCRMPMPAILQRSL